MTGTPGKTSASKSRLLACLKHAPDLERQGRTLVDLSVDELPSHVRREEELSCRTCISRFRRQGIELATAA